MRRWLAVVATVTLAVVALLISQRSTSDPQPLRLKTTPDPPYGPAHPGDQLPVSVQRRAATRVYCNDQKMDIYLPPGRATAPAVLYAHPGSYVLGDKSSGGYVDQLVPALTARGFVVATIIYRLAPKDHWPAPIQDVACAIRFLRAHHGEYRIDPNHIGAWGASAGAQLVSLLGTVDRSAGFDVGPYREQSSRLQAVVDMYGPVDVPAFVAEYPLSKAGGGLWGPASAADPTALVKASPGHWASRSDPPFLILQGDRDKVVPLAQSVTFARRLRAAGVPVKLVVVRGGNHGLVSKGERPSRHDLLVTIVHFFQQHLMSR